MQKKREKIWIIEKKVVSLQGISRGLREGLLRFSRDKKIHRLVHMILI